MPINPHRLSRHFINFCEIDSPSRNEAKFAGFLRDIFADLGAESVIEDNSAVITGSDTGNIIIRFTGTRDDLDPVFFNCHLDVIGPCLGVKVHVVDDFFYSSGSTVLGADDKAGIAILVEVISSLLEDKVDYGPFEIILTTCEEIGLLGAKSFDRSLARAHYGYALDSTGVDNVIIGAPAAVSLDVVIRGLASHAGLKPRNGINAIQLASKAISRLEMGELDDESTANIGIISGGTATNIIPDSVIVSGELRSHSPAKLQIYIDQWRQVFQETIDDWSDPFGQIELRPTLTFAAPAQYPSMLLSNHSPVVQRAKRASSSISRDLDYIMAGGGSDANFFNSFGLPTAILGIGMEHVHSTS